VIGLSTLETPATTSGFVENLFPDYKFLEYRDVVVKYSDELKSDGAEIILLVAHVGNDCPQNKTYDIRTAETPQEECPPDEITNLIDVLPEGTIHGIVQGHRHEWVHHWKKGKCLNICRDPFYGSYKWRISF
jgi:2',3'-cyclic-nucleotide 2'-phosphodiesterase (5'-nucleotidase family)